MAEEAKVPEVPAPVEEKHPDGAPIVKGADSTAFWPTEAKAMEIAKNRVKGARRAFVVKDKAGKTRFATGTHPHYVMEHVLLGELGYEVTEVGKPQASKAPVSATGIMAAIDALPEAERENVRKQLEEQLKQLTKKK